MTKSILFVTSSASGTSRSTFVAEAVRRQIVEGGASTRVVAVSDFDAGDVLAGRSNEPQIASFIETAKSAAGIVLATPVYKAVYSGALKALVDLIPPDALVGKAALGIATSKLVAHATTVDAAYQSLFTFFQARALPSLVVLDAEIHGVEDRRTLEARAAARAAEGATALLRSVS